MSLALNIQEAEESIFLAHKMTFRLPVSCLARYIGDALKIKHTVSMVCCNPNNYSHHNNKFLNSKVIYNK